MSRVKNMCFNIVPIYYGDRPATTRGKPSEGNDYYFQCYVSANKVQEDFRQSENISELCDGCKKYMYIKPLSKDEIREKYSK